MLTLWLVLAVHSTLTKQTNMHCNNPLTSYCSSSSCNMGWSLLSNMVFSASPAVRPFSPCSTGTNTHSSLKDFMFTECYLLCLHRFPCWLQDPRLTRNVMMVRVNEGRFNANISTVEKFQCFLFWSTCILLPITCILFWWPYRGYFDCFFVVGISDEH